MLFLMLSQDIITFSVNVCFKRFVVIFTIILACLGTKEYNDVLNGYHLFHITMKLYSLNYKKKKQVMYKY